MCKICIVRAGGVEVLTEEEILPKNRITPLPKPQKTTAQVGKPKTVVSSVASAALASQCSVPHSPRFNGVGEIDPSYYESGSSRRGPESRHRRHSYAKVLRRTAMAEA